MSFDPTFGICIHWDAGIYESVTRADGSKEDSNLIICDPVAASSFEEGDRQADRARQIQQICYCDSNQISRRLLNKPYVNNLIQLGKIDNYVAINFKSYFFQIPSSLSNGIAKPKMQHVPREGNNQS